MTPWGRRWQGPAKHLSLSRSGGHPEILAGRPIWAVKRWRSPFAGLVRLNGLIERSGKGKDGSTVVMLLDGCKIFEKTVGGDDHPQKLPFDLGIMVKRGSRLDIAVTPGPENILAYDSVTWRVRITRDRE